MSAHKEAFALMWYVCACGHRERIWNSRDGVTPFGGVPCFSCGGSVRWADGGFPGLRHVNFHQDEPAPEHKLRPGQAFWRDGTPDEAVAILERRFALFEQRKRPAPPDVRERMLNDVRMGISDEFRKGWPFLDRCPE